MGFIHRVAERTGSVRVRYEDDKVPDDPSRVVAIPFFGDMRSAFILATYLAHRIKERQPRSYLVVCSWPGLETLFPYADEFWTVRDRGSLPGMADAAIGFFNRGDKANSVTRLFNQNADRVVDAVELSSYYENGFRSKFWDEFSGVVRHLPPIPPLNTLSKTFRTDLDQKKGRKVVIYPARYAHVWDRGQLFRIPVPIDFWTSLVEALIGRDIMPVSFQDNFTYDISPRFATRCMYLVEPHVTANMAGMRAAGCVLDVHSGVSRLAIGASCPFLFSDERQRFAGEREYEIDDLTCETLPRRYIFSRGLYTQANPEMVVVDLVGHLDGFLGWLEGRQAPELRSGYEDVSFDRVRRMRERKSGVHFIRRY